MSKITLQTVFKDKIIICGVEKNKLEKFITFLLEQIWMNSKVPGAVRKVKESRSPSVAALYDAMNVKSVVAKALDKQGLFIENIGPIEIGLKMKINVVDNTATPSVRIEIDKFVFERDDRDKDLKKLLEKAIGVWAKLDVKS